MQLSINILEEIKEAISLNKDCVIYSFNRGPVRTPYRVIYIHEERTIKAGIGVYFTKKEINFFSSNKNPSDYVTHVLPSIKNYAEVEDLFKDKRFLEVVDHINNDLSEFILNFLYMHNEIKSPVSIDDISSKIVKAGPIFDIFLEEFESMVKRGLFVRTRISSDGKVLSLKILEGIYHDEEFVTHYKRTIEDSYNSSSVLLRLNEIASVYEEHSI